MTKRASLTLRKPGATNLRAVDDFIGSAEPEAAPPASAAEPNPQASEPDHETPTFRRASKAVVARKTKTARRRTTVYMDLTLAVRLAKHCESLDIEMSEAVNAALEQYLAST